MNVNETGEIALLPENYSDKVFAILLGLADGATHARQDIDPGAAEILPLYLADGLLEALEWANDGAASDEAACMWLASLRAYRQLNGSFPADAPQPLNRWIDDQFASVEVFDKLYPGDEINMKALDSVDMGQTGRPRIPGADSTGVLPRAAVAALLGRVPVSTTESLARAAAYLTHDADAAAASVAAAKIIRAAMERSEEAFGEFDALLEPLTGAAAEALRQVVAAVKATSGMSPTEAYDSYFAVEETAAEEESDVQAVDIASADEEPTRDPEVDAFAVALLCAVHGSDAVGERPASALDDIISELHDRWMALLV